MITSVTIDNFRCIRHAEINLTPLTVFVGPNGSGKSTIIDALDASHSRGGVVPWHGRNGRPSLRMTVDTSEVLRWHPGLQQLYDSQILNLRPDLLRKPNRVSHANRLQMDGSNLANVFATLSRRDQEALSRRLCELVPVVGDVDVQPTSDGNHQLRFQDRWDASIWYPPTAVSDGTMLMTAFLTLQFQESPVALLAIEDPEHALHPYLLSELAKLLRSLSDGTLGPRKIQVVAATHSADLLDYLDPSEVRFVSRDPSDGGVTVNAIDEKTPQWEQTFREYKESLADVWLSGGAGGV